MTAVIYPGMFNIILECMFTLPGQVTAVIYPGMFKHLVLIYKEMYDRATTAIDKCIDKVQPILSMKLSDPTYATKLGDVGKVICTSAGLAWDTTPKALIQNWSFLGYNTKEKITDLVGAAVRVLRWRR